MNNVVIFSMLFMMLLFNLDSFLPAGKAEGERPLLPQESYVLKIEQGSQRLERAGQQWRQVAERIDAAVSPENQINAWQSARLKPVESVDQQVAASSPYVVVVWLAGQSEGLVVGFYPGQADTWVKIHGQWFLLTGVTMHELLPWNPA
ncbi:hypothetical protein DXV75_16455 [Alteromonas aestuariivivens]|uniref:Uncharacterized protein n=2 Tax=Alteromonas aestuariivivens TaxID=1938339 RepID=A0A3D8M2X1_9ALTE|nr:hypothetical protein DXV75_16455 [Alteromonas aestuariivivens]